ADANEFHQESAQEQERLAVNSARLADLLGELLAAAESRDAEPSRRWQMNYDYIVARVQIQIVRLDEYSDALGQVARELQAGDARNSGWRLVPRAAVANPIIKRHLRPGGYRQLTQGNYDFRAVLSRLVKDHAGTPWAWMAQRDLRTSPGLRLERAPATAAA